MRAAADLQIQLTLDSGVITAFYPLLQQGICMPAIIGCSVMKLLNDQFGIAETYVQDRITTLFLDGKPVDDLTSSLVDNGSVLALSAAMPGLVGSTMRRGGHLAAMRGEITYRSPPAVKVGAGTVTIKLFNMLMKEVGPLLLERGTVLEGSELMTLLTEGASLFMEGCDSITLNDLSYHCAEFIEKFPTMVTPHQTALVKVIWNVPAQLRIEDPPGEGAS